MQAEAEYLTRCKTEIFFQNILSINRRKVLRWTPRILAIWDLEMPLDNKFRTFLAFFESLSFFDSAENGRPSFLPDALRLAKDDFVR